MNSKLVLFIATLLFLSAVSLAVDFDRDAPENFFDIQDKLGE